jgi:hypothetical protein
MLVSMRRLLVFSLLGPVMGVALAVIYELIARNALEVDEGTVLAFLFSLGVAIATGPVDG